MFCDCPSHTAAILWWYWEHFFSKIHSNIILYTRGTKYPVVWPESIDYIFTLPNKFWWWLEETSYDDWHSNHIGDRQWRSNPISHPAYLLETGEPSQGLQLFSLSWKLNNDILKEMDILMWHPWGHICSTCP